MRISGKYLIATVNGAVLAGVMDWSADHTVDDLDGTTGADAGKENGDTGVERVAADLTLVQDLTAGVAIAVKAGTRMHLELYRDANDPSPAFDIPVFQVLRFNNRGAVKDKFTAAVSGKSRGDFTFNDPGT